VAQQLLEVQRTFPARLIEHTLNRTWGIILAAGEGTRVSSFLTKLCGGRGIKQFCAVMGGRTLLQDTVARVEKLIPRERILVIVDYRHRSEASEQLGEWPEGNLIYQPTNRETAPGILLPLAHVLHRDPKSNIVVFPSDHFIIDEQTFMAEVARALGATRRFPEDLILLGLTPDRPEDCYGWIETQKKTRKEQIRRVQRFWEKPSIADAEQLMARGALWNIFVFAVRARTLWEMTRRALPELHSTFESIRLLLSSSQAQLFIEKSYETMPTVNFSKAVLEPLAACLRVVAVPDVGWSDWGCPERILESAKKIGKLHQLLTRLDRAEYDSSMPTLTENSQVERGTVVSS
jgi:mannose-1-phosphate guanylyltransferase